MIAHLHVDDVVLIHLHPYLHVTEIGDAHDLGAGILGGAHNPLSHLVVKHTDRAVHGRVDIGFAQHVAELAEHALCLANRRQRGLVVGAGDIHVGPGHGVIGIRDQLLGVEIVGAAVILLGLVLIRLGERAARLGRGKRSLLLIGLRGINVRIDADDHVALLDQLTLLVRQGDQLPRNLRCNPDFELRLHLAGGRDEMRNGANDRLFRRHRRRLFALPSLDHRGRNQAGQHHDSGEDPPFASRLLADRSGCLPGDCAWTGKGD